MKVSTRWLVALAARAMSSPVHQAMQASATVNSVIDTERKTSRLSATILLLCGGPNDREPSLFNRSKADGFECVNFDTLNGLLFDRTDDAIQFYQEYHSDETQLRLERSILFEVVTQRFWCASYITLLIALDILNSKYQLYHQLSLVDFFVSLSAQGVSGFWHRSTDYCSF